MNSAPVENRPARIGDTASASQAQGGVFSTTHWSVVLAAKSKESREAAVALEELCRAYWYPLYVYVRRRGYGRDDALDLTQQFFAHLLKREYFRLANPCRGRFRTFLLCALEHFLVNEWKRAHCLKRGGGTIPVPLEVESGEERYVNEFSGALTPEQAYDRRWATTLLDQVLASLKAEYLQTGHARVFDELAELLWGKDASVSYAQIGERLGMTEVATRGAMHRLRHRFRERLRAAVTGTVANPGEVDEELRYLISVVSQRGSVL